MSKANGEYDTVKSAILAHSVRLFCEKGVHETSIGDIAEATNLSKGTLYYHYKAKSDLVNDVADMHLIWVSDVMFTWVNGLERNCTDEVVLTLFDMLTTNETESRLHCVLLTYAVSDETLIEKLRARYKEWRIMLEVGSLKMASPYSERTRALSELFFTIVDGCMLETNAGITGSYRDQLKRLLKQ